MSAMAAEKRKQVKRVVLAEVAGLLALLRRNEKFSTATTSSGHKRGAAAALVVSLEKLRDKARGWKSDQPLYPNPLEVMHPFFQVVRSAEASGPFTGAALKSLTCLLRMGLLELDGACVSAEEARTRTYTSVCGGGLQTDTDTQESAGREDAQGAREGVSDHGRPRENGNGPLNGGEDKHAQAEAKALRNYREQRAEAVCELLDAVIHSRFEETDSQLDEVVKMRIIQLLAETVESPAGRLLSDEAVWEAVQTCLVNRNEVAHSKMLCHAAEQALFRIVRVVFTQLTLACCTTPTPDSADTQPQQQHGAFTAAAGAAGTDTSPATPPRPRTLSETHTHTHTHTPTHTHHNKPLKKGAHAHRGIGGYGLPCAVKIFGFLCSQLLQGFNLPMSSSMAGHPYHASLRVVCLRMIREALETAGPSLSSCPPLLALIRDDLCLAIIKTSRGGHSLEVLCEALGVIRCLWATLRRFLKMQFEAIFKSVFLRVLAQVKQAYTVVEADDIQSSEASKKNDYTPSEQQVILETLCDLLADPSLLADLFANYDCDIQRYDLLESLTRALADCAKAIDPEVVMSHAQGTPGVGVLPSSGGPPEHALVLRGLCMDALLQMLRQLYMRCDLPAAPPSSRRHRTHTSSSSSTSSLVDHLGLSRSGGEESSSSASSSLPQAPARPSPASPTPTNPRGTLSETMQRKKWKRILQRGAEQFNQKPRLGLSYLVSEGVIPELTPAAVAKFLRTAPGLDYEAIGGYLGECGHPEVNPDTGKANYRADTTEFHKDTLKEFVNTFHFQGQPLIAALRMFLATFRLPGEAQQIDRILQAFANVAFESCAEAQSGLLASADVAYLLAFSIIMLNTDLHNPNIRPEKRMTVSDFCKNNRNYGNDISQGKDLPPEFLETIYKSISEHPILSYDDSPEGEMTADRWRDLVRQAETDDEFGYMVVHDGNSVRPESGDQAVPRSTSNTEGSTVEDEETASGATNGAPPITPSCGVYDKEMVQWLWRPFLAVAVKSFVGYDRDPEPPGQQQAGGAYTTAFLRQSVDMMLLIAKVTASHGLQEVFDTLLYLLCGFTGLLSDPPIQATADMPWDMQDDELEEAMADAHGLGAGDTSQAVLAGKARMGSAGQSLRVRDKLLGRLLYRFVHSPAAQMALVSVFGIAHRLADSIKSGWRPVLLLIFRLRDMKVLSKEVLRESDGDLLSPEGREAFMEALRERVLRGPSSDTDGNTGTRTHAHTRPKTYHKTSSGGSRFLGGFVSYLFSSSASPAEDREALLSDSPYLEAWDFGLPSTHAHEHTPCASGTTNTANGNGVCVSSGSSHTQTDGSGGGGSGSGGSTQQQHSDDGDMVIIDSQGSEQKDAHRRGSKAAVTPPTPTVASVTAHTASPHTNALPGGVVYVKSLSHCRVIVKDIVANCKVAELVTDSRYVRLESLGHMVRALVGVIHTHTAHGGDTEGSGHTHTQTSGGGGAGATEDGATASAPSQHEEAVISAALSDEYIARIRREIQLPGMSPASVAFAEVLLVEVALRNRDRVSALWPKVLSEHYRVRLAHVAKTGKVTLATEKVVHGLLRLCVRLFSRDGLSDPLSESLTWMVPPSMPSDVTRLFAPLIGAGVWRMLTSNLSSLPGLSLRGWKAIFDAIEACAPCGGEATARAFEGLCFLLHEPQLKACVPVTCSSAVLAFITCPNNQEPLCRAALDLLMLLHARLDVMLRSQSAYANEAWPRCWSAILEALATAAKDMRLGVRCHALYLLSEALLDQQSQHVGAPHLHRLLANVVIPLAQLVHSTSTDPLPPTHTHSDGAHTQQRRGSGSSSVSGRGGATQAKPPQASSAAAENVMGGNNGRNGHVVGVSDQSAAPVMSGGETGRPLGRLITLTPSAFKAKELALSMVTSAFLVHLKDLLLLPTFHELWLKVLEVMEAYQGTAETQTSTNTTTGASAAASANGRGGSKGAKDPAAPLERPDDPLSELALEKLKNMLLVMSASGAFEPGEDTIGKELWELTWAVIGNFKACPDLREDLFGTHAPPTPAVVVASSSSVPSVSAVDGPTAQAIHASSTSSVTHDAGAATSAQDGAQLQQASLTDPAASNSDRSNSGGGDVSGSDAPVDTRNEPSKNDGGHGKGSMNAGAADKGKTAPVMAPGAIVTA